MEVPPWAFFKSLSLAAIKVNHRTIELIDAVAAQEVLFHQIEGKNPLREAA
jgi:hypothetical protein